MSVIPPSDHILSLLGGKDNLELMCAAHNFHQTRDELSFAMGKYKITVRSRASDVFDKMYDLVVLNTETGVTRGKNYVCDWWIPDLFTIETGYHLSF